MLSLALLLVGLAGLWFGTELALRATLGVARRHGLSERFLGVSVLAIGTDLPELVVAVDGGLHQLRGVDASGVIVGNAIGSALTQGSLVLGLAGLLGYLRLAPRVLRSDGVVLVLLVAVVALLALDGHIDRLEAGVLLLLYAIYWRELLRSERPGGELTGAGARAPGGTWLALGGGLLLVVGSAELVVHHAVQLAAAWGLSQSTIGVLLIGAGTSLPELALSLGAAARGRVGLSVANVLGSNIFDVLVPVGVSGLIHPLTVGRATLVIDLPFLALIGVATLVFFGHRRGLQRGEAGVLLALWVGFVVLRLALG